MQPIKYCKFWDEQRLSYTAARKNATKDVHSGFKNQSEG